MSIFCNFCGKKIINNLAKVYEMSRLFQLYLIVVFLLLQNIVTAQMGCTDSQAMNYDATATTNNGSCEYATTNYSLQEIAILTTPILETSGLAFFDNQLWTHNDAGNEDKIYQIDTMTGAILNTVIIANSENTDWEDLAEDDTHIYIGDFGNNAGNRMDLKIYKCLKSQLASGIATAEVIEFSYEDQTDFTVNNNNNNYDCEAFFFYNDSLHLFSKNWVDQQTRHYVIPSQPGTYVADLRESMDAQGLITGADISDDGVVAFISYNTSSGKNAMWLCFDFQGSDFFSGNKRKISLGLALNNSQTEAIVFRENGYGYVSSEQFASLEAKLLSFESAQWTEEVMTDLEDLKLENTPFEIFPNPVSENVNILFKKEGEYQISLIDVNGRVLKKEKYVGNGVLNWDVNELLSNLGVYFFSIKYEENVWVERIIVR